MAQKLKDKHPELYEKANQNKPATPASEAKVPAKKSVLGDLEGILAGMIENYEKFGGKARVQKLIKDNPSFEIFFIKELYGLLRKFLDVKAAEARLSGAAAQKEAAAGGGGGVTQNFFIIKGLHDGGIHTKQVTSGDMEVIEAEFRPVGLDEAGNG